MGKKKVRAVLKLELQAGKATPAPPVGTAPGPHGINIMEFTKAYNERTAQQAGDVVPALITIFEDRSCTFVLKTPPAVQLPKRASEAGQAHRAGWAGKAPLLPFRGGDQSSVMPKKRGKKYIEAAKKVEAAVSSNGNGGLDPETACKMVRETSISKFDATVEAHIRLGVDPRHAEQMVRGSVVLPNGTGKKVRVAVFAVGEKAREAQDAGADVVGGDDLVKRVTDGWTDFDSAIATPDMMSKVGPLGKVLGPRGLM